MKCCISAMGPLLFLLKLAWDCRYRLPLLITVGFMVLDVRMQLDINIQMRQIPRPRPIQRPPGVVIPINDNEIRDVLSDSLSESKYTFNEISTITQHTSEYFNFLAVEFINLIIQNKLINCFVVYAGIYNRYIFCCI